MKYLLLTLTLLVGASANAQYIKDSIPIDKLHQQTVGLGFRASSGSGTGFWLASNNSQRFPSAENNAGFSNVKFTKSLNPTIKGIDFGYGFELLASANLSNYESRAIQGYGSVSYLGFVLTVGRKEESFGLSGNSLGFGHLTNSNNARPMDKISFSTNGWLRSPILGRTLFYKAYFSHGQFEKSRVQSNAFLHQKYFYLKFQPAAIGFDLQAGLTHNAQWGGHDLESSQPTGYRNYLRILLASSGGSDALLRDQNNALGNHLGTYDIMATYHFTDWNLSANLISPWEDRSGLNPKNWRDGLFGLSFTNNNQNALIGSVRFEYVNTTNQNAQKRGNNGAPFLEPDNFLNNGVYGSGWTYRNVIKGSSIFLLIDGNSIIQNSVKGFSLSATGSIRQIEYGLSFREFTNRGTILSPLEPPIKVNSLLLSIRARLMKEFDFQIESEYNSGNFIKRRFSSRISLYKELDLW